MNITEPEFVEYIGEISESSQLSETESAIFQEMEAYAKENRFPIIGQVAGRFLRQLAMLTNALNIFEMGSGYGYSAMWLSGGMAKDGRIICTDNSEENKNLALAHFEKAGRANMLEFQVGNALEIINKSDGLFDIILNDIDKEQYPEAFDLAMTRLRRGGVFITDNVLWSGRIFDSKPTESTKGIVEFNRKLFASDGIFSTILPIHDGLAMAIKL